MAEPKTGMFDVVMYKLDPESNELVPQLPSIMLGYYGSIPADLKTRAVRAEEVGGEQYYYIPKEVVLDFYPETFEEKVIDEVTRVIKNSPTLNYISGAVSRAYEQKVAEPTRAAAAGISSFLERNVTSRPINPQTGLPMEPALPTANGVVMDGARPPMSVRTAERQAYQRPTPTAFELRSGGTHSNLVAKGGGEVFLFWDPEVGDVKPYDARGFIDSKTIAGKELSQDQIDSMAARLQGTPYLDENYDKLGALEKRQALRDAFSRVGQALTEYNYQNLSAGLTQPTDFLRFGPYIEGLKQRDIAGTTSTSVSLSGRGQSDVYATNAAREYLGRNPTAKEKQKFLNALNAAERAAPTVTTTTPIAGGGSSTVSTTGGVSGQITAEEFMRRQPGSGSYQIATDYFDAFVRAVGNPTSIATPERF